MIIAFINPFKTNINILSAVALYKTNISSCLYFSMQNIEMFRPVWSRPLLWAEKRQRQLITFFVCRCLRDVIHVSSRRNVHEFHSLAVRITSGLDGR